tara:strand:+ start:387 stop:974 length:588 start_codon:yes stop_codon:yes gene_type:complete
MRGLVRHGSYIIGKKSEPILNYKECLTQAMALLAQDKRTIFLGQSVLYSGNAVYGTMQNVPKGKIIEFPVAEEMQMGVSIGLSLMGYIPISIFPRFDFLLLAFNQLVNHLDKCEEMTNGEFNPKVIVRTVVGSKDPLYPGVQHCQDYTAAMRTILQNVNVVKLCGSKDIIPEYRKALRSDKSTLIIEMADMYGMG